jgi:hypothetical protein
VIEDLRLRGYKDGLKAWREAKQKNAVPASTLKNNFVDDKVIAKNLMEELKQYNVRWKKCFHLAIKYSFGYDDGVLEAVYGE